MRALLFGCLTLPLFANAATFCPVTGGSNVLAECEANVSAQWPGSAAGHPDVVNPGHSCAMATDGNPVHVKIVLWATNRNGQYYSNTYDNQESGCSESQCDIAHAADDGDGLQITGTGGAPSGSFCGPITQCKITVVGPIVSVGSSWIGTKKVQNAQCEPDYTQGNPGDPGNCIAGGGVSACGPPPGGQCGTVNGDWVCPGTQPGGCTVYASGGSACFVDASHPATTPPAPDNGTPGTPPTPTATVYNTTTHVTTNYYSSTVTGGSSRPVSGTPGSSGTGGASADGGDGVNADSAGGGEYCTSPPTCTGNEIQCAILHQEWLNRCPGENSNNDIVAAVGTEAQLGVTEVDVTNMVSETGALTTGGSCPADVQLTFMGHTVTMVTMHWMCNLAAALSGLIMASAYLSAIFIVSKAVLA